MQYNETQLAQLIKDVEREFTTALVKAEEEAKAPLEATEAPLVKAEEEKPEPKKEEKPAPEEGEKKPEAEAKPEAKPEAEAAPEEKPAAEAEAKPEGDLPAADIAAAEGHDYDAEDMAHLEKMYMSMSKGELKVHHDACRAALDKSGMAKCGEQAPEAAPMAKSEINAIEVKTEAEVGLLKSELDASNAKYDELKKNFDAVSEFLTKLIEKKSAPEAKAITSLDAIAKSESVDEEKTLTKNQVHEILCKKTSDPSLAKSDREAINVYYAQGQVNVTGISHLLK